ncbi:MAG: DUF167 domain-containing protein [Tepidisphaeraceae bacterium]|jgi:hypothetical protein
MPLQLIQRDAGVVLHVKVVPGSSRDRIVGPYGDGLKITVTKPPEGGAANKAVVTLLAEALGLPARNIQILRGQTGPRKDVFIRGITADALAQRLMK